MTDEQKYMEILKEIGELLKRKNDEIVLREYEIRELKRKLMAAERVIAEKHIEVTEQ